MKIEGDGTRTTRPGNGWRQSGAANIKAVVGGAILIALVAYGLYRMAGAPAEVETDASVDAAAAVTPFTGTPIQASAPIALSPKARIAAERYRCICGCNDTLGECTCTRTPGSIDMKEHLVELVDRGLTMTQVDEGMVAKYGDQVLLSNPPAAGDAPEPSP